MLLVEVYWGFILRFNYMGFNGGYSLTSFVVLYFIGRYIRLYGLPQWIDKFSFYIYIACSLFLSLVSYCVLSVDAVAKYDPLLFQYCNPIIILAAVTFFNAFKNLRLPYNRVINWAAKSVIGILLIHCGNPVWFYYTDFFRTVYTQYDSITLFGIWFLALFVVMLVSVLIDQVRLYTYHKVERFFKDKNLI